MVQAGRGCPLHAPVNGSTGKVWLKKPKQCLLWSYWCDCAGNAAGSPSETTQLQPQPSQMQGQSEGMGLLSDPQPAAQRCTVGPKMLLCILAMDVIAAFPLEGSFIMHAFS